MGREVMYGADKPTGGFFVTEFYSDLELTANNPDNDVVFTRSELTLTNLNIILNKTQRIVLSKDKIDELIRDWRNAPEPTPLQFNVARMFHSDIAQLIQTVNEDLKLWEAL